MSFTLCTSGAIVNRAGLYVNPNAKVSGAILEQFSDDAEGYINGATRYDWVANYSSVGTNFKNMLATAASCLAAIDLISYDKSGYTNLAEADNMVNVLYDRAMNAIKYLADSKLKNKMGVTE
jgi:hypothetical protein